MRVVTSFVQQRRRNRIRRRQQNRRILFARAPNLRHMQTSVVYQPTSPTLIPHSMGNHDIPSRTFLIDFCYKHWSRWTEDARQEVSRLTRDLQPRSTHEQQMTLLNVELLYARLTQVQIFTGVPVTQRVTTLKSKGDTKLLSFKFLGWNCFLKQRSPWFSIIGRSIKSVRGKYSNTNRFGQLKTF